VTGEWDARRLRSARGGDSRGGGLVLYGAIDMAHTANSVPHPAPEAEEVYRRWIQFLDDEFTRHQSPERRAEIVRDQLYQLYLGRPHGGKLNLTLTSELPGNVLGLSLDPYGGSYDVSNPQSFNRYASAGNSPLSFVDPSGLLKADPCVSLRCNTFGGGNIDVFNPEGDGSVWSDAISGVIITTTYSQWISSPTFQDGSMVSSFSNADGWGTVSLSPGGYWDTWSVVEGFGGGSPSGPGLGGAGSGAPNNAQQNKQLQCAGEALKKNGVSLALDAAGFIPGESQFAAGAQTVVAGASFANSLYQKDAYGATSAVIGGQITGVGWAATQVGASWAKAVPVVGYVFNGIGTARDLWSTYGDYQTCMSHP